MVNIKILSNKQYMRKQKRNTIISNTLDFEIRKTQEFLSKLYKKRFKRKKFFTRVQASDYIAEVYRLQRYKKK